ncbi:N-acetylglutamate synthase, CG3035 family [Corynebacterium mayonis]|uniref:N-acetylglutamate synthase, CG3035 family n=1 Tax=Corynebacterium mayonis TaxID=3062461 RepID=UPI0031409862
MNRFFRSDDIAVGDRVVVRQRRGERFSDVLGHVIKLDPLTISPQEVGGLPSFKDAIEVRQVHIVKKLSPRTVRNSDIRAVETAYAKAFPGQEQSLIDGWLARTGSDIAERSNSAVPLGHSAGFEPVPLEGLKNFYARFNQPVQLLIPERIGKPALKLVEQGGWELGEEILVMTQSLDHISHTLSPRFAIDPTPDQAWLSMYRFRGQKLPRAALDAVKDDIDGHLAFARLIIDGETVAVTRATLTNSEDGRAWLGYSAVEVAHRWRRQGLGTELTASLLAWGHEQGADSAYLQTRASNEAAVSMYTKIGFVEHHRHRYARLG